MNAKCPPLQPLATRAWRRLDSDPLFQGRVSGLEIEEHEGRLIVRGRLPSFYLKQLLQTRLRQVEGVASIENQVDVQWPEGR